MEEAATIYEVARDSGVSIASVSRVLHGQPGVSTTTQRRVHVAMRRLDYVPNGAARGLASKRVDVIGLLFPDFDDTAKDTERETLLYYDEVIRGAERAARRKGLALLIVATGTGTDPSGRSLVRALAGKVDGVVVVARSVVDADVRFLAKRVPVAVLAGRRSVRGTDYIAADNESGAYAATGHLIEVHGYTDIVFLAGPRVSPDSWARFVGFRKAMRDAGLRVDERPSLRGNFGEEGGRRAIAKMVHAGRRPRAIVAANDQMAVGALRALAEVDLAVPEQVAVTGFDDIQLARRVRPALTTVRQPMRDLGSQAVELLIRRVADTHHKTQALVLPTVLVVRASCGCPPALAPIERLRLSDAWGAAPTPAADVT
jgi:LacI family transcriptional regulator